MVESTNSKICEQIEWYLSDANLSKDKFFREQILADKEGWVQINHFLNCNKVKQQKWALKDIADALSASTKLELNKNKLSVRRAKNEKLPEFHEKKRDAKAADKQEQKQK